MLLSNRYEMKFQIDARQFAALRDELLRYMAPDEFASPAHGYRVRSIYFDSVHRDFYWAKLESTSNRRKLRIRLYGQDRPTRAFLEIKEKLQRTIRKRRVDVTDQINLARWDPSAIDLWDFCSDDALGRELFRLYSVYAPEPAVGISYWRHAFVSPADQIRITFDYDLRLQSPAQMTDPNDFETIFFPATQLIMEIKVRDTAPAWLAHVLQRHELAQRRYSKYCSALATLFDYDYTREIRQIY